MFITLFTTAVNSPFYEPNVTSSKTPIYCL